MLPLDDNILYSDSTVSAYVIKIDLNGLSLIQAKQTEKKNRITEFQQM